MCDLKLIHAPERITNLASLIFRCRLNLPPSPQSFAFCVVSFLFVVCCLLSVVVLVLVLFCVLVVYEIMKKINSKYPCDTVDGKRKSCEHQLSAMSKFQTDLEVFGTSNSCPHHTVLIKYLWLDDHRLTYPKWVVFKSLVTFYYTDSIIFLTS